jgi:hypothetical protein
MLVLGPCDQLSLNIITLTMAYVERLVPAETQRRRAERIMHFATTLGILVSAWALG